MSIYMAARGAGRSFPVFPRTVSIYSNNYRKMHGMPMMRHVHLRKIEKKKLNKLIEEWDKLLTVGPILTPNEVRYVLDHYYHESFVKFALPTFDLHAFEPEIASRILYGQPVIDQKAVVKIVTSGEENGDE